MIKQTNISKFIAGVIQIKKLWKQKYKKNYPSKLLIFRSIKIMKYKIKKQKDVLKDETNHSPQNLQRKY